MSLRVPAPPLFSFSFLFYSFPYPLSCLHTLSFCRLRPSPSCAAISITRSLLPCMWLPPAGPAPPHRQRNQIAFSLTCNALYIIILADISSQRYIALPPPLTTLLCSSLIISTPDDLLQVLHSGEPAIRH